MQVPREGFARIHVPVDVSAWSASCDVESAK